MHDGPALGLAEVRGVRRHGVLTVHDGPVDLAVGVIAELLSLQVGGFAPVGGGQASHAVAHGAVTDLAAVLVGLAAHGEDLPGARQGVRQGGGFLLRARGGGQVAPGHGAGHRPLHAMAILEEAGGLLGVQAGLILHVFHGGHHREQLDGEVHHETGTQAGGEDAPGRPQDVVAGEEGTPIRRRQDLHLGGPGGLEGDGGGGAVEGLAFGFQGQDIAIAGDALDGLGGQHRVPEEGQLVQEEQHPQARGEGGEEHRHLEHDGDEGLPGVRGLAARDDRVVDGADPVLEPKGRERPQDAHDQDHAAQGRAAEAQGLFDAVDGVGRVGLDGAELAGADLGDGLHQGVGRLEGAEDGVGGLRHGGRLHGEKVARPAGWPSPRWWR